MADTYFSQAIVIGQGPVMTYGTPTLSTALRLGPETLTWALETLEDLYLLLEALTLQLEQQISEIRK